MKKYSILFPVLLLLFALLQVCTAGQNEKNKLEISSLCTTGNEANGLEALSIIYSHKYPDITIINVEDFSTKLMPDCNIQRYSPYFNDNWNFKFVEERLQEGNPPDTFQVRIGKEFIDTWVVPGKIEPITFILKDKNWISSYYPELIDMISYNEEVYSIPISIHRSNVLWYNKSVFHANTIEPPVTMADFFQAAEKLISAGITPLSLGNKDIRAATHLLENLLLEALGPAGYTGLWDGKTAWDSGSVTNALENFVKMLSYVNTDHKTIGRDQAAQYIMNGTCAMTIIDDRVESYFTAKGLIPDKEFGWKPFPGTKESFMMFSDSFCLPVGVHHREQAIQWLTVCASQKGQDALNPLNGSIPGRLDPDRNLYDAYFQSAMDDFPNTTIVPSMVHGTAAQAEWVTKINDVMNIFITEQDVDKAVKGLAEAAKSFIE